MAPLSVHRPGRGTRNRIPEASHRSWASARGHAAADEEVDHALGPAGGDRLPGQDVDHGLLEARRDVRDRDRLARLLAQLHPSGDRGLESGEREVEPVPLQISASGKPPGEVDRELVALARGAVDVRTADIRS